MKVIDVLLKEPVCIYAIINVQDKKVMVGYTTNIAYHLGWLQDNLPRSVKEDTEKVEFRIIETYNNRNELYLKARVDELYKDYGTLGYTFYTAYKPLQWVLYVNIEVDSRVKFDVVPRPYVKLKTSANKRYYIKACDTLQEAEQFVLDNSIVQALRCLN